MVTNTQIQNLENNKSKKINELPRIYKHKF